MTFFLTFLLLLVGGGTAGADGVNVLPPDKDCPRPNCLQFETSDIPPERYDYDLIGSPRIVIEGDCVIKMEKAMRAMDPWREWFIWRDQDQQLTKKQRHEFTKANTQWHITKNECWSKR